MMMMMMMMISPANRRGCARGMDMWLCGRASCNRPAVVQQDRKGANASVGFDLMFELGFNLFFALVRSLCVQYEHSIYCSAHIYLFISIIIMIIIYFFYFFLGFF